jgi:hypothetical protein
MTTQYHATAQTRKSRDPVDDKGVMFARGRLSNAKKVFVHRGWDELPQDERGRRILEWGADHAWLAGPANPERSVRNWCRHWWPSLSDAELAELVARIVDDSNKRWTHDQSAAVLEITVTDREELKLWFLGADDDPNYTKRQKIQKAKNAAKSRRWRAAHSTGAKVGRPALQLSEEDKQARRRAQGAERKRAERERKKEAAMDVTLKPVRDITLITNKIVDNNIGSVTAFSVTDLSHEVQQPAVSRPRQADRRQEPIIWVGVEEPEYPEIIVNDDGTLDWAPFAGATGALNQSQTQGRSLQ